LHSLIGKSSYIVACDISPNNTNYLPVTETAKQVTVLRLASGPA